MLTGWGPERGLAQMVLSRRPFGYRGNLLQAGINAIAMAVAMIVSIALFSNQQLYVGVPATAFPAIGDITFEVGFVLAVARYAALRPVFGRRAAAAA